MVLVVSGEWCRKFGERFVVEGVDVGKVVECGKCFGEVVGCEYVVVVDEDNVIVVGGVEVVVMGGGEVEFGFLEEVVICWSEIGEVGGCE